MNIYRDLKDKHQKMLNDFPMAFAFSTKQFEEAKEKLGVKSADELYSIPGGGMIRKSDGKAYGQLRATIAAEQTEAEKEDEYMYQGLRYELGNHEFIITYDPDDALGIFGLNLNEVMDDERLSKIFLRARNDYLQEAEEKGWG